MRNFSDTICGQDKDTHFVLNIVFFKSCRLWDNVGKCIRAGQGTDDNMARAHCMLYTYGYKHTLTIRNTYCFPTTTMVTRTLLNVRLYVHWPCLFTHNRPNQWLKILISRCTVLKFNKNCELLISWVIYRDITESRQSDGLTGWANKRFSEHLQKPSRTEMEGNSVHIRHKAPVTITEQRR
jgi:hypothetical protein